MVFTVHIDYCSVMGSWSHICQVECCCTVNHISGVVGAVDYDCHVSCSFVARNVHNYDCAVSTSVDIDCYCRFYFKLDCSVCPVVPVVALIGYICSVVACLEVFYDQFGDTVCEVHIVSCTVDVNKSNSCNV